MNNIIENKAQDVSPFGFDDSQEHGAVLLLTLAIVAVFFVVMLYGIELSSIVSSVGEQQYHARFVTLAALEEYYDTECTGSGESCHEKRMEAALARAQVIAGYNVTLKGKRGDAANVKGGDKAVTLRSGRWYSTDDGSGACKSIDKEFPCFVPGSSNVNAFNLSGQVYQPAYFFAKTAALVDLIPQNAFNVDVVASVIPRHACFLVDISGSVQRTTHLLKHDRSVEPRILRTQFAYFLEEDGNSVPNNSPHELLWTQLLGEGERPAGAVTDFRRHFYDDYELKTTLGDSDYGSDPNYRKQHPDPSKYSAERKSGNYRFDFYRDETHLGPEPLTTILAGLYEAVSLLDNRAVAGDKACIIFYDNELAWTRVMNLTDNFDYLKSIVDPRQLRAPKDAEFGYKVNSLTDLPPALAHNLFPALDGYTFSQQAMAEAMSQFKEGKAGIGSVSNFIVHIGDGLSNCSMSCDRYDRDGDGKGDEQENADCRNYFEDHYGFTSKLPIGPDSGTDPGIIDVCAALDINGDQYVDYEEIGISEDFDDCEVCDNQYFVYEQSMKELRELASNTLFKGKIPLHAILVGDHVQPHTIDVEDQETGECLTDAEAREQEKNFTHYLYDTDNGYSQKERNNAKAVFDTMFESDGDPFIQANYDWYSLARMTGGFWGPIRPVNPLCSDTSEQGAAALEQARGICVDNHRRIYDDLCRTPAKQIQDYMGAIMEQNPYAIVSSR